MSKKPMIVLTGPTAVGKTALSIDLAKKINGAIISADSMQVYKYMDIGSAKITKEEMQGIDHYLIDELMPEVKDHEPRLALDGTEDGLFFYRKIVEDSRAHLVSGGMLYFEIGYDQAESVSALMREAGFAEINVVKDYAGLDRVVYGTYITAN